MAQAAYVATGTLVGSAVGQISTVGCRAVTIASTSDDQASTHRIEDGGCSELTVKIYYTNPAGYAGWTSTASNTGSVVTKKVYGSDELRKSYHTAIR